MKKYAVFALFGVLGMGIGHYQSYAYDPVGHQPVLERVFKEFSAAGFRLGTFTVIPSLDTSATYTSNVQRTSDNETSETLWRTRATLSALSEAEKHETDIQLRLDNRDYQTTDSFDHLNFSGFAGFKYRMGATMEGRIEGRYERAHQTRYETGATNAAFDPVRVDEYGVNAGLSFQPGSVEWDIDGGYREIRHANTTLTATGAQLVQEDRDQNIYDADVRLAFRKFSRGSEAGHTPFLGFSMSRADFINRDFSTITSDFTGADQSNTKYNAFVGVNMDSGGKLRGTARVGYGTYEPDDGSIESRQNAVMNIDLTYLYTPLTNFIFGADRFFTNSTDSSGGTLQTRLSASVIHELTRQWILRSDLVYIDREFDVNSEDQTWQGGLGFSYRMNRNISINGNLDYITRESNVPGGDYDEARAMLRLNTKF